MPPHSPTEPHILNAETRIVAASELKPHPQNPNVGDVAAIAESIRANGFYGYVLAQLQHDDGSPSLTILAGEHRWKAARRAGLTEIPVTFLDVDDSAAQRIVLADNETARKGYTDHERLLALLEDIQTTTGHIRGTGYSDDAMERLLGEMRALQGASEEGDTSAKDSSTQGEEIADDAFPEDEPLPVLRKADVSIQVGMYRLTVGHDAFLKWRDDLREDVGFDEASIRQAIKERLGLDQYDSPDQAGEEV